MDEGLCPDECRKRLLDFALEHAEGRDGRIFLPWTKCHKRVSLGRARDLTVPDERKDGEDQEA